MRNIGKYVSSYQVHHRIRRVLTLLHVENIETILVDILCSLISNSILCSGSLGTTPLLQVAIFLSIFSVGSTLPWSIIHLGDSGIALPTLLSIKTCLLLLPIEFPFVPYNLTSRRSYKISFVRSYKILLIQDLIRSCKILYKILNRISQDLTRSYKILNRIL